MLFVKRTRAELRQIADLMGRNDDAAREKIAFWDAGAPSYRWMNLITTRLLAGVPTTAYSHRVLTYVALAMYDATVATWESKYFYGRPRPSERSTSATRVSTASAPSTCAR